MYDPSELVPEPTSEASESTADVVEMDPEPPITPNQRKLLDRVMTSHVFTDHERARAAAVATKDAAQRAIDWATETVKVRKAAEKPAKGTTVTADYDDAETAPERYSGSDVKVTEVSDDEIRASALQYVRKVSGTRQPSAANLAEFELAVAQIAHQFNMGPAGAQDDPEFASHHLGGVAHPIAAHLN